ncbi:Vomeronasal 2, receptor 15 [Apodemus speciosus]|uniref:Vomeronasal 2, receptor 15 n=1 Tax=Apodemus speciosus TaxID=105296 RepID=A0ABQ0EK29_APOSI
MCSVPCTAGFRKMHQEETADCCFNCVQCPENEVSNETGTGLDAEENMMNLSTFSSKLEI